MSNRGIIGRSFSATLVAVVWVLAGLPIPAQAGGSCGLQSVYVDSPDNDRQYGMRVAENLVIDPAAMCGLVRSVYVWSSQNNFVEVGWFQNGSIGAISGCQDFVRPHVFAHAFVDGEPKCKQDPPLLPVDPDPVYSFKVDNISHDFDFNYWWDTDTTPDQSMGYWGTPFMKYGWPVFATERHNLSDSLRATLDGVNSLGGGGEWHDVPLPISRHINNDISPYEVCSWSSHHLTVKSAC
jgi:hypothetical protein